MAALRAHKAEQAVIALDGSSLVFQSSTGGPISAGNTLEAKSALNRLNTSSKREAIEMASKALLRRLEERDQALARWREERQQEAEAARKAELRETFKKLIAEQHEIRKRNAEIERIAGISVWKATPRQARRLTEQEQFERDIMWRAGVFVG